MNASQTTGGVAARSKHPSTTLLMRCEAASGPAGADEVDDAALDLEDEDGRSDPKLRDDGMELGGKVACGGGSWVGAGLDRPELGTPPAGGVNARSPHGRESRELG